jgi:hypothetical protein
LRTKVLKSKSKVYARIPTGVPIIRVVRLKPGGKRADVECELVTGTLQYMEFDALSYVWGVTLMPYKIWVNGQPFYVTHYLYEALGELRLPDRERLLWIDAMCINQHDNAEKGKQVQMMRDIYARATQTVVWLGNGSNAAEPTMNFIRQFSAVEISDCKVFWWNRSQYVGWRRIRRKLNKLLEYEWWKRAWASNALHASYV